MIQYSLVAKWVKSHSLDVQFHGSFNLHYWLIIMHLSGTDPENFQGGGW